ncbi:hypothetical protein LXL04_001587 [Taraxacum kok-saghyz]
MILNVLKSPEVVFLKGITIQHFPVISSLRSSDPVISQIFRLFSRSHSDDDAMKSGEIGSRENRHCEKSEGAKGNGRNQKGLRAELSNRNRKAENKTNENVVLIAETWSSNLSKFANSVFALGRGGSGLAIPLAILLADLAKPTPSYLALVFAMRPSSTLQREC